MKNNIEAMHLIKRKKYLENRLELLVYGSVEVRDNNGNKYVYVHYREDGKIL